MTLRHRAHRVHGGPDADGPARWDFSANANAVGPCPSALAAVRDADVTRYPDPGHCALRERLAQWHGVARERILIAASASEFIQRITAVSARVAPGPVAMPEHAYGDYAAAAKAWGRGITRHADASAALSWHADPSSPLGRNQAPPPRFTAAVTVLDAVYAPLRLEGVGAWTVGARDAVFELHSPNKALGLTGVRGAYAIAPAPVSGMRARLIEALDCAAPSWPLGAHGVAMLDAWTTLEAQHWLAESRDTLRRWKRSQVEMLQSLGAQVDASVTSFFCVRLPFDCSAQDLREHGIAVRDTASFGLPGRLRLNVQPPGAQDALEAALRAQRLAATKTRVTT